MKKIHLLRPLYNTVWPGASACHLVFLTSELKFLTVNTDKVTCKNCKRTGLYRGKI